MRVPTLASCLCARRLLQALPYLSLTFSQKLKEAKGGSTPAEYLFAQPWELSYTLLGRASTHTAFIRCQRPFAPAPSLVP